MEELKNRILEIAKIYNAGNAEWLTNMVLTRSKRVKRALASNKVVSDETIHDEVYYFEEEYIGDCWEQVCFG